MSDAAVPDADAFGADALLCAVGVSLLSWYAVTNLL